MFNLFKNKNEVSVKDVTKLLDESNVIFIDVREINEYKSGHAINAVSYPLSNLQNNFTELQKYNKVYVICQSGARSIRATDFLTSKNINAVNVNGGTVAWKIAGLPLK